MDASSQWDEGTPSVTAPFPVIAAQAESAYHALGLTSLAGLCTALHSHVLVADAGPAAWRTPDETTAPPTENRLRAGQHSVHKEGNLMDVQAIFGLQFSMNNTPTEPN